MSRPHDGDWKAAVMQYCTALLMALGMALCALRALLPRQALWPALLLCAPLCLGFQALFSLRMKRKWLLPLAAVGGLLLWFALGGGPLYTAVQLGKAGFLTLRGIPDAAAPYADAARWTVCLLFSLLAAALSWDDTLPLAVFCVAAVVGLSFLLGAEEGLLLCALPAAAGMLLMLARDSGRRLAALPVAAALTLAAFFLLPAAAKPVPALEKAADTIRQFVEDYLLFNEYRSSFSLADEGFLPLEDRLGGKAEPETHSVMEVATGRTVLLRGRAYNDYSGLNWYDTLSARRYLYASPRFSALRDELFDFSRPLAGADAVTPETIRVHRLGVGPTTLFAPLRTRTLQMEGERMVLYYNLASELFLTRDFAAGDAYTLTYLPFAAGDAATEAAVSACASRPDAHYDEAAGQYLSLPPHIQQEIFDLAAAATAGAQTPYAKALAIQNYLRTHYTYSLTVKTPPDGVDFVAWFLLGEKTGYCTYFASAMTVLCRAAGLPARYVTGYLAVPEEDGVALVTGEDAHAWTEVYLSGFGWLDFDATPRSDNQRGSDAPENPNPSPSPSPAATPTPPPPEENSPAPSESPSETPTDQPSESPSDQPAATPTPPPGAPSPAPQPDAERDQPSGSRFPWLWLLLLAAVIALSAWRYRATDPGRRAARRPNEAASIFYTALRAVLSLRGVARKPQETLLDFGARADRALAAAKAPAIAPLTAAMAAQLYGNHPAPADPFRAAYQALWKTTGFWGRLRLILRRMLGRK